MRKHGALQLRGRARGKGRGRGRGKSGNGVSRSSLSALAHTAHPFEAQRIRLGFQRADEETTPAVLCEDAGNQMKDWLQCERCGAWREVVTDAARELLKDEDSTFFCEMQPPDDCAVVDEKWLFEPSFPGDGHFIDKNLDLPRCLLCLEQLVFRVPPCGLRVSKLGSDEDPRAGLFRMIEQCKVQEGQTVKEVSSVMKHIYQQIKKPFLQHDWSQILVQDFEHTSYENNWLRDVDSAKSPEDVYNNGTTLEDQGIDWNRLLVVDEFLKFLDSIDDVRLGEWRLDYVRNKLPGKIRNINAARSKSLIAGASGFAAMLIQVCEVLMGGKPPQLPVKQEADTDSPLRSNPSNGQAKSGKRMKVKEHFAADADVRIAEASNLDRHRMATVASDGGAQDFTPISRMPCVKLEHDQMLPTALPKLSSNPASKQELDSDPPFPACANFHDADIFGAGDDDGSVLTLGPQEMQAWGKRSERVSKILKAARDLKKAANSERMQEKSDVNKLRNLLSDLKKVMDMYSGIIPDPEDDDDDVGDIEPQSRSPSPIDACSEEQMPIKRELSPGAEDQGVESCASSSHGNPDAVSETAQCGAEEAAILEEVEEWLRNLVDGKDERALSAHAASRFGARLLEALRRRLRLGCGGEPSSARAHICELEQRVTDVHDADLAYAEAAPAADFAELDRLFDLRAHSADVLRKLLGRLRCRILPQYRPAPADAPGSMPASSHSGNVDSTGNLASAGTTHAARGARDWSDAGSSAFVAVGVKSEPMYFETGRGDVSEDEYPRDVYQDRAHGTNVVFGAGHFDSSASAARHQDASGADPYACLFSDDEIDL